MPSPETTRERELRLFIYELGSHLSKVEEVTREILDPTTFQWVSIPVCRVPANWYEKRDELMTRLRRLTT